MQVSSVSRSAGWSLVSNKQPCTPPPRYFDTTGKFGSDFQLVRFCASLQAGLQLVKSTNNTQNLPEYIVNTYKPKS